MKTALIVGYPHPFTLPGGSFRIPPLAKYLPEFGWEPVILTPFLLEKTEPPFRVIETPYGDTLDFWKKLFGFDPNKHIKRQIRERFSVTSKNTLIDFILTRGGEVINYPDSHKGWKPHALKAGNKLLQHENIDAIISCHPVISHIIASDLKANYGIPWIADFADLWSQNHNYGYSPLRRALDRRLEIKTLSKADALITVSQPWAEKLKNLHKRKSVYTITHGFDPEEINEPPTELTVKFTITYTGSIYTGKQDVTKLFAALQSLISDGTIHREEIEVRFYGFNEPWLEKEIRRYELSGIIKQYGRVPPAVAAQKQRESQLLLLLDWDDPQEKGVYTGKIFDYLAARRPMLATGGLDGDVVAELLNETKAGIHATTVDDVRNALKELYQEHRLKGKVAHQGKKSEISKYNHREMVKKFAGVLEWATSK